MWALTQMPEPSSHFSTKAMDEDDIRTVIDGFAVSARNAVEAGFDGIEIKVAHDGLLRRSLRLSIIVRSVWRLI
jgi:2,4-dienoyl-CoA reductase-like NADH-dependent reductase (Old Yellow Enzyme family)